MFAVIEAMEINMFFLSFNIHSQPCENTPKSGFIDGFCMGIKMCRKIISIIFMGGLDGFGEHQTI